MSLAQTLVVPVDVRAFCVGSNDESAVLRFSGATLDFSRMTAASDDNGAPIIESNNQVFRDGASEALAPLEPGIHLHWNLPRALTHGKTDPDTGAITFPPVPNRWLVTRIIDTESPLQNVHSWVVESDWVSQSAPDAASITIFTGYDNSVTQYDNSQPYSYLGRVMQSGDWTGEPEPNGSRLKQITLSELTAMQTGDPLFASFYPSCRNIFGLHDDLSGVVDDMESVRITYVVVGWYSLAANDILQSKPPEPTGDQQQQFASLLGQLKWSLPDGVTDIFDRSLYVGQVQGIVWQNCNAYVPSTDEPVEVNLGLGNNGAEAMSALLGGTVNDPAQRTAFETLLTAYQLGVISTLQEPHPDRMTEMLDKLHSAGFTHMPSGTVWTCVQNDQEQSPVALTDLPPDLIGALVDLNKAQAVWDDADAHIDAVRRQLHLDWYRWGSVKLVTDNPEDATTEDWDLRNGLPDYIEGAIDLLFGKNGTEIVSLNAAEATLTEKLSAATTIAASHGWVPKALNAPWYWKPNDPIVGLSGKDLVHRLQSTDASTPVLCRPANQLLQGLTVAGHTLLGPATQQSITPPVDAVPVEVWDEAMLLNASWLSQETGTDVSTLQNAVQEFLAGGGRDTAVVTNPVGVAPLADAVQWWTGANQWLPLFMWWTADYYPLQGYNGTSDTLPVDYITGKFALTQDGVLKPNDGVLDNIGSWPFYGRAILTPLLACQMEQALGTDEVDPDLEADIKAALAYLEGTPILYQALSGFTDALLMLGHIPQLVSDTVDGKPGHGDINDDDGMFHSVTTNVGNSMRLAAYPNSNFAPLRAGTVDMELTLVDVFGWRKQVPPKLNGGAFRCAPPLHIDQEESLQRGYLPPRFSQPVRLNFDFLSAADGTDETSLLVSPVCGWLLPNHLERTLMVYDTDGVPRGMLDDLLPDRVRWMGVPGPDYNDDLDTAMAGTNPHQHAFVRALCDGGRDGFANLISNVNTIQASTTGSISQDPGLSLLIGRPIALVQVGLSLDLLGPPAVNQSWAACETDIQTALPDDPKSFVDDRVHNGVTDVEVNVILGSANRFRDGVLGFFMADGKGGYDFTSFYSPAEVDSSHVTLSIGGSQVELLMLVDPLSDIHAISGMLPTQKLTIPPDWTVPVLDKLSVTFPVRPVLAAAADFDLPLPTEAGYSWSWVQHQGGKWTTEPITKRPSASAQPYVPQRIFSGWLQLSDNDNGA
jgi:hypothetical protein